jgi:hypothetical protein
MTATLFDRFAKKAGRKDGRSERKKDFASH